MSDLKPLFLLLLFMIWTLFSTFNAKNRYLAFYGTSYRLDGYISYIAYAGCFGLAYSMSSDKTKKALLYAFVITVFLNALITQLSTTGIFLKVLLVKDVTLSSFFNINHYGYYLLTATAVVSFLFITEKKKILKVINLFIYTYLLYFLIINNTFGCYLALIFTLIVFLITTIIKKENKWPVLLLITIFVIVSIFVNMGSRKVTSSNFTSLSKDLTNIFSKPSTATSATTTKNSYTSKSADAPWMHAGSGRMKLWAKGLEFIAKRPLL